MGALVGVALSIATGLLFSSPPTLLPIISESVKFEKGILSYDNFKISIPDEFIYMEGSLDIGAVALFSTEEAFDTDDARASTAEMKNILITATEGSIDDLRKINEKNGGYFVVYSQLNTNRFTLLAQNKYKKAGLRFNVIADGFTVLEFKQLIDTISFR